MNIRTYEQLIEVISDEAVPIQLANKIVNKYIEVYGFIEDRNLLIKAVNNYVDRWGNYFGERPLFLD